MDEREGGRDHSNTGWHLRLGHEYSHYHAAGGRAMGAWVAPMMGALPGSRGAFGEAGLAHNPTIDQRLRRLGAEVAQASAMFAVHWIVEENYQQAFHQALVK